MEKQYDVIYLPDRVVAVDKHDDITSGILSAADGSGIARVTEQTSRGIEIVLLSNNKRGIIECPEMKQEWFKVVATFPALDGVPLLPPVPTEEDDIEQLAFKSALKEEGGQDYTDAHFRGFKKGYKARAAKGTFTLEQIVAAIQMGREYETRSVPDAEKYNYETAYTKRFTPKQIIEALTTPRKRTAVVLEVQEWESYGKGKDITEENRSIVLFPKLDANGSVIVKHWIYEKD